MCIYLLVCVFCLRICSRPDVFLNSKLHFIFIVFPEFWELLTCFRIIVKLSARHNSRCTQMLVKVAIGFRGTREVHSKHKHFTANLWVISQWTIRGECFLNLVKIALTLVFEGLLAFPVHTHNVLTKGIPGRFVFF